MNTLFQVKQSILFRKKYRIDYYYNVDANYTKTVSISITISIHPDITLSIATKGSFLTNQRLFMKSECIF